MARKLLVLVVLGLIFSLAAPAVATANSGRASVFVVHGIPGQDLGLTPALPVDVSANGACILKNFMFKNIAGPLSLPPGNYTLAISLANAANPCGNPAVIGPVTVPFMANKSYSVVAHLTAAGAPTASVFTNDLSRSGFVRGRVIAHHTAAAPTVDVTLKRQGLINQTLTIANFSNGNQAAAEALLGIWNVTIAPAGSPNPVFGPVQLTIFPRTAYLVYAVGSIGSGTFTLLTKPVFLR
jgi:hypothetical protein